MGDYVQKELTGSLFKNDKKESEKHPDYKGSAKVEGVDYWLSAWVKETKGGAKYFSLALKAKGEASEIKVVKKEVATDDNLPF